MISAPNNKIWWQLIATTTFCYLVKISFSVQFKMEYMLCGHQHVYFAMIRSSEIWSFFYKCPRPNPLVASFLRLLSSKLHLLTFQRPESPPEFIWRTLVDLSPLLMIIVPDRFPSLCFGLSYFHFCSALNALSSGILVFGSIVILFPSIFFVSHCVELQYCSEVFPFSCSQVRCHKCFWSVSVIQKFHLISGHFQKKFALFRLPAMLKEKRVFPLFNRGSISRELGL